MIAGFQLVVTHLKGDSKTVWFEGNYADYEADRKKRLGAGTEAPIRIKYRKIG